jgi:hypothetical protein
MNIEVHSVGYLYIMDLITVSISMKQTRLHVNSAYVIECVMRLWVCKRIRVQLKVSVNVSCFSQYTG